MPLGLWLAATAELDLREQPHAQRWIRMPDVQMTSFPKTGEVNEARRLRQLVDENRELKHLVVELMLDVKGLRRALSKEF